MNQGETFMKQTETLLGPAQPDIIERLVVDNSQSTPRYIAVSHNEKYLQISASVYDLLKKVREGYSYADIAQAMCDERKVTLTPGDVERAYWHVMRQIHKIDSDKRGPKNFWLKLKLLPASWVAPVASRLTFVFHPAAVLLGMGSFLILFAYAFEHGLLHDLTTPGLSTAVLTYLLFLLSLAFHEFGHASACARGKVRPSEIGFAIYLFFPVFYSNVSSSWQLSRWKRIRVDIGGIYLQLWVGVIYLLVYFLTHIALFQVAFISVIASCFISFNPLLKFDGYWILTDILNISHLSKQPTRLFKQCCLALLRKPREPLAWSPLTTIIVGVYGLLRSTMWIGFFLFFGPFMIQSLQGYPSLILHISNDLQRHSSSLLLADIQNSVYTTLMLLIVIIQLGMLCLPLCLKLLRALFPHLFKQPEDQEEEEQYGAGVAARSYRKPVRAATLPAHVVMSDDAYEGRGYMPKKTRLERIS
jgi:putative peptide zinc metalloprotease protein